MKRIFIPLMAAVLFSCGGNKTQSTSTEAEAQEAQELQTLSLAGDWRLNDYAGEAEMAVMDSTQNYLLHFSEADNTFGMQTDCNSLGGQYKVSGDSLVFENIAMTQMACPSENVERAMASILPMVTTYTITPDSTLLLRSDARIMATFSYVKE